MTHAYEYPRAALAVDCVVFGLDETDLKVLLIQRKLQPFQHTWALKQLWAFIVFPLVGGLLGALLWRTLVPAEDA